MKQVKRAITLLLAVLMVLSLTGVQVLAADKEEAQPVKYLAIGDSISRGCGAAGFYADVDGDGEPDSEGQYACLDLRNVKGSFPFLLAQKWGCVTPDNMTDQGATYWPCCYPGMTTAMFMDLIGLEDNYSDTKLQYPYYGYMMEYFGCEQSAAYTGKGFDGETIETKYVAGESGKCGNINDLIVDADIITLQIGMSDAFYRAYRIASNGGSLSDGAIFDISSPKAILTLVKTLIEEIKEGYDHWEEYYPQILAYIKDKNPDATIVIVGALNLVNQVTLADSTKFPLGSMFSVITEKMNRNYEKWAKEYGVLYTDVSNAEALSTESGWSLLGDLKDNAFVGTHPSQKGYDYITRQILNTLEEPNYDRNIVVDLGRFNNVESVSVDGKLIFNYKLQSNGYTVEIKNDRTDAKLLTVISKDETDDSNMMIIIYKLTYHTDTGYTAHRLYAVNHCSPTVCRLVELVQFSCSILEKVVKA